MADRFLWLWSVVFISACTAQIMNHNRFEVIFEWSYLNYTWLSPEHYNWAIKHGRYNLLNNAPTGMKFSGDRMFLSVPRFRKGIPLTLAYLDMSTANYYNPLLSPFPSWQANDDVASCENLQSVQSMEIDTTGVMWVIDGVRINDYSRCPSKLLLLDVDDGSLIHSYTFPDRITKQNGGFLNDIVVDESNGGYAFITDNSVLDPGIIVYSRALDDSWKLKGSSMWVESRGVNFFVNQDLIQTPIPVDGIALSPRSDAYRTLYFGPVSGFTMYSLPVSVARSKEMVQSYEWSNYLTIVGEKVFQSDGLAIDEASNMYLTMLPTDGVAEWNIDQPFSTMHVLDENKTTMYWTDGFGFDQQGYLYLITNKIHFYIDPLAHPSISNGTNFRVMRIFTGTRGYLYG